ncbi:unnamed protein product [Ranitomeya imitator]|uniref:N(6)-adenosine-methyltransferase non-catalytic subunit METTL14 n=1 Tax=Ranitomeya imitator TaxID=111125 RepID=A0ABN9MH10_9NEOB|nr:unnamed protein product [Ranitomeya imitator]
MNSRLQEIRARQKLRRTLLAKQLGAESADNIGAVLNSKDEQREIAEAREMCRSSYDTSAPSLKRKPPEEGEASEEVVEECKDTVEPQKEEENLPYKEEIYKDSSTFLKGTQSLNPHNDYCQHFVDTGHRPQNFIRDVGLADRFEEYPKLRELIRLKDDLISVSNTPPMYLQADLETFDLRELKSEFDVILLEPPLEEYYRETGIAANENWWTWEDIMKLDIEGIAGSRAFVFLWCGSGEGLDFGRMVSGTILVIELQLAAASCLSHTLDILYNAETFKRLLKKKNKADFFSKGINVIIITAPLQPYLYYKILLTGSGFPLKKKKKCSCAERNF